MATTEQMSLGHIIPVVLLGCFVAQGQEIRGRVTVDRSRPLVAAIIKIEVPGGASKQARTDVHGRFAISGLSGDRVLISVLQGKLLVHRSIMTVRPGSELAVNLAAVYDAPPGFEPFALTVLPGAEIFISDGHYGRLQRFLGGKFIQTVADVGVTNDLAAAIIGGEPAVFACVEGYKIVQYDRGGSGRPPRFAPGSPPTCTALAADARSGTIYVATREPAIYRFLAENRLPSLFVRMPAYTLGGGMLSAMAVDPERRMLYAGDTLGSIFRVGLDDRKTTRFAHELGSVEAIALDSDRKRLYAIASGQDRIWQFNLGDAHPATGEFLGARNVRSADAIGVDPTDGTVYIGDRESHALLVFSPDGDLRSTTNAK